MAVGRSSRPLSVFLLVLSVAWAGCADPAAVTGAASSTSAPTFLERAGGTGTLTGRALDDERVPVAGAEIVVASRENSSASGSRLSTDAAGVFTITGLEGGTYLVYARKIGYEDPAPKSVNIVEGETTNVTMVLRPLAPIVAFKETKTYTAIFDFAFCVTYLTSVQCTVSVTSGGFQVENWDVKEEERGELATLLAEARWTAGSNVCPGYFRTDVFSPDQQGIDPIFPSSSRRHWVESNPYHWDNVPESFRSPTRLAVQRTGDPLAMLSPERTELNGGEPIATDGSWTVTIDYYPEGASNGQANYYCVVEQDVEMAVTFFYVDPLAPADWSAFKP